MRNVVLVAAVAILASCGKKDSKTSADEPKIVAGADASATQLEGVWDSGCFALDVESGENRQHTSASYEFSGSSLKVLKTKYSDSLCKMPSVSQRLFLSIQIGKAVSAPQGAIELDSISQHAFLTLHGADVVAEANKSQSFGFRDWKVGLEKEVTGKKDSPDDDHISYVAGEKSFTIFKIDGDKLYFGTSTSSRHADSPSDRHNQLETIPLIRKK